MKREASGRTGVSILHNLSLLHLPRSTMKKKRDILRSNIHNIERRYDGRKIRTWCDQSAPKVVRSRPAPGRLAGVAGHWSACNDAPSRVSRTTFNDTSWIASCDRFFPSTLPQKPATVAEERAATWLTRLEEWIGTRFDAWRPGR